MRRLVKPLALWTCIGMFLVLVMGALVTKTESGRGCGDDWPLCNGKFVPAYTIESFIEYSHRFVSGLVGLLVLATFIAVWRFVKRRDARVYASGAGFFTVLQAGLGAMAVVKPQSPPVLALHFGFSLLAFACTLLLYVILRNHDPSVSADDEVTRHRRSLVELAGQTGNIRRLRSMAWLVAIYSYGVVYLGAYIRHTSSSGGCTGWPLCNGEVIPDLDGATGIVFVHRLGAVLLLVLVSWLAYEAKRSGQRNEVTNFAAWSLYLVLLQILSGAFVTFSLGHEGLYLAAGLIHAVIIAGLFGTLTYLCALTLQISLAANEGGKPLDS